MKRLHVHLSVEDIAQSVRFYSTLFAADPAVLKDNYAKWMQGVCCAPKAELSSGALCCGAAE